MPWVDRDGQGVIVRRYARRQRPDQEFIEDDAPEAVALELAKHKAASLDAVRTAGFARVHRDFPPHAQLRLALKSTTDDERKACAALIEAVKAEVDKAEAAIAAAGDEAAVEAAVAALALPA